MDSIWKLKVSSADSFLLDFNRPWRFTIFIHPEQTDTDGERRKREETDTCCENVCPAMREILTLKLHRANAEMCQRVCVRYSLSRQTRIVSLSSWVTWITHVCGMSL